MSRPPTVLVVDDDPDFREFVRIVLESQNYQVIEADNAAGALALMHKYQPDAVLLDAMISYELAGIGIIRAARADEGIRHIPLILISAVLSDEEDRFLPAGERRMVDRFLGKPISPDALLAEVGGVLSAHALPRRETGCET